LSYQIVRPPANGTLSGTAPNLVYTPNAGFSGTDSFTFRVSDGRQESAEAGVTLIVTAVNAAPVAHGAVVLLNRVQPGRGAVVATASIDYVPATITLDGSDADGDRLNYQIIAPPTHGRLTGTAPDLVYTPDETFYGRDQLSFVVSDGVATSDTAMVVIVDPEIAQPMPPLVSTVVEDATGQQSLELHVAGVPLVQSEMQVSTNLVDWQTVASGVSDEPLRHIEPIDDAPTGKFYRVLFDAQPVVGLSQLPARRYAGQAVGYVTLAAPPGYSMIANPLDAADNTVGALLPEVPEGTLLYRFEHGGYKNVNGFELGRWDDSQQSFAPGEGMFMFNPTPQPLKLTFLGKVPQGTLRLPLERGYSMVASVVPQAGPLDQQLGYVPEDGDLIFRFNPATKQFDLYEYIFGEWSDSVPNLRVGEAFFIHKLSPGYWTRTFTVDPSAQVPARQ
jgi:hypothetical protein